MAAIEEQPEALSGDQAILLPMKSCSVGQGDPARLFKDSCPSWINIANCRGHISQAELWGLNGQELPGQARAFQGPRSVAVNLHAAHGQG